MRPGEQQKTLVWAEALTMAAAKPSAVEAASTHQASLREHSQLRKHTRSHAASKVSLRAYSKLRCESKGSLRARSRLFEPLSALSPKSEIGSLALAVKLRTRSHGENTTKSKKSRGEIAAMLTSDANENRQLKAATGIHDPTCKKKRSQIIHSTAT